MAGISPALQLAQQQQNGQLGPGSLGTGIKEAAESRAAKMAARAANLGDTGVGPDKAHPVIIKPNGGRTRRRFKKHRLMSRKYCKKTPCRRMGFTQKASCRPYKNCYTRRK